MQIQLFQSSVAGLVRISGEDALPYLQSQLTIDLHNLPVGRTRMGLRLSLKGKVLFGAQIICTGEDEFLLICKDTHSQAVIDLLEQNVVADEVEFEPVPEDWKEIVLYHPTSVEEAFQILGIDSILPGHAYAFENGWVYLSSLVPSTGLTIMLPQSCPTPWADSIVSPHPGEFHRLRLQERLFLPGREIGEDEFPQEGGLHRPSVDFNKGCYLGQEVMARIHAMGNVRKQAVAIRGTGNLEESLPSPLLANGKKVGSLKSQFLLHGNEKWVGAAVVHENATGILETKGLLIESNGQSIYPLI